MHTHIIREDTWSHRHALTGVRWDRAREHSHVAGNQSKNELLRVVQARCPRHPAGQRVKANHIRGHIGLHAGRKLQRCGVSKAVTQCAMANQTRHCSIHDSRPTWKLGESSSVQMMHTGMSRILYSCTWTLAYLICTSRLSGSA